MQLRKRGDKAWLRCYGPIADCLLSLLLILTCPLKWQKETAKGSREEELKMKVQLTLQLGSG